MSSDFMFTRTGKWGIVNAKGPNAVVVGCAYYDTRSEAQDAITELQSAYKILGKNLLPMEMPMLPMGAIGFTDTGRSWMDIYTHAIKNGWNCTHEQARALLEEFGGDIDASARIAAHDYIKANIDDWMQAATHKAQAQVAEWVKEVFPIEDDPVGGNAGE